MIASTPNGWQAMVILTVLLLTASCNCHHKPISWIGNLTYTIPNDSLTPLKNQVIVWKNPDSSEEAFKRWLSDLKQERPTVQALAVCAHCDSDMILLYDTTLLPYLQSQTVGGTGGSPPSGGPSGGNGPTLFCANYSLSTHDTTHIEPIRQRLPARAISLTWPKPKPENPLTVAVFDTGLDSAGDAAIATVGQTCFQTPQGMSSHRGWNFSYNNANTHDDMPDQHGTKVTRIIMDQAQLYGGTGVNILPVKIFDSTGKGTLFGMLCAFAYASGAGAKIVNASFGFYHYADTDTTNTLKIENMLGAFMNKYLNATGMLLVAAAGNDETPEDSVFNAMTHTTEYRYLNANRFYPALFASTYPNVITVTTVSQRTQKPSPYENTSNSIVDIGAQCDTIAGGDYLFFDPIHPAQLINGVYTIYTIEGSSFAAPIVTGRIAALYNSLPSKTDKHLIIPAMNTTANGRIVLSKDKALQDSIINGELAP